MLTYPLLTFNPDPHLLHVDSDAGVDELVLDFQCWVVLFRCLSEGHLPIYWEIKQQNPLALSIALVDISTPRMQSYLSCFPDIYLIPRPLMVLSLSHLAYTLYIPGDRIFNLLQREPYLRVVVVRLRK